ncbi:MAG: hypothetical protein KAT11_04615, partial [Phycisphaerae bacterium]|nr:hypothetical protein [Phycisphaerae bacterium]
FFQFALGLSDKDYLADAFRQKRAFPIARKADKKKIDHAIRQVIAWKRHGTCINKTLQEAFAKLSDGHLAELRWLRWAMRRPFNHERSFWAQVRDRLKDEIGVLVATDKLIEQRRPLGSVEHDNLSYYCSLGRIKPTSWLEESGDITVENVLMPDWRSIDVYEIDQRVEAILVPIAYQLAMRWKDSQAWPRFVVTCRNPACGQKFYSALPNAVACPKRKGEFGPSKCKRGWDNYSKWLKNICEAEGTDPEKVWDEPQRKKEFLKTWRPRRPQSPYS